MLCVCNINSYYQPSERSVSVCASRKNYFNQCKISTFVQQIVLLSHRVWRRPLRSVSDGLTFPFCIEKKKRKHADLWDAARASCPSFHFILLFLKFASRVDWQRVKHFKRRQLTFCIAADLIRSEATGTARDELIDMPKQRIAGQEKKMARDNTSTLQLVLCSMCDKMNYFASRVIICSFIVTFAKTAMSCICSDFQSVFLVYLFHCDFLLMCLTLIISV